MIEFSVASSTSSPFKIPVLVPELRSESTAFRGYQLRVPNDSFFAPGFERKMSQQTGALYGVGPENPKKDTLTARMNEMESEL